MAKAKFSHVAIRGCCTVIPRGRIFLDDERSYYADEAKVKRLKATVGLNARAVVDKATTPGDLMECAARRLISGMGTDMASIDSVMCVLDYPDHRCPPTSCELHGKLGLPTSCIAFDVNHGCAGYVYGLYVAHSLIESNAARRVLLLVGDTKSRTVDVRDRVSAPIFGDGAAATLLERTGEANESWFVLGADGRQCDSIIVPAGGARLPSSPETQRAEPDGAGNVRSLDNFRMNGRAVFDFTMNAVPANIAETLSFAGKSVSDLDFLVLHQANRSIIQNIALRIGVRDLSKVPTETLARYGNLAVASIPSVLNDCLSESLQAGRRTVLVSGFGVGLAYGSAVLATEAIYAPRPFTYGESEK